MPVGKVNPPIRSGSEFRKMGEMLVRIQISDIVAGTAVNPEFAVLSNSGNGQQND